MGRLLGALERKRVLLYAGGGAPVFSEERRVRLVGLRGGLGVALVSVAVVGAVSAAKGAASSPAGGGAVGPLLIGRTRVARVRQHGGGSRRELGFQQRRDAHALTANAAVLRGAFWFCVESQAHPRGAKHPRGRAFT